MRFPTSVSIFNRALTTHIEATIHSHTHWNTSTRELHLYISCFRMPNIFYTNTLIRFLLCNCAMCMRDNAVIDSHSIYCSVTRSVKFLCVCMTSFTDTYAEWNIVYTKKYFPSHFFKRSLNVLAKLFLSLLYNSIGFSIFSSVYVLMCRSQFYSPFKQYVKKRQQLIITFLAKIINYEKKKKIFEKILHLFNS